MRTLSDPQGRIDNLIDNYRKLPFLIIVKFGRKDSVLKLYIISSDDFALARDELHPRPLGLKRMNELGIHLVSINGSLLYPYDKTDSFDQNGVDLYETSFTESINRVVDVTGGGYSVRDEYLGLLGAIMLFSRDFEMLSSHPDISKRLLDRIRDNPLVYKQYMDQYRPFWSAQNHADFKNGVFSKILKCIEAREDLANVIEKSRIESSVHDDLLIEHAGADTPREKFENLDKLLLPKGQPIIWAKTGFDELDSDANCDCDD